MSVKFRPEQINEVSSCFCLAKWLQVTVDVVHGLTHSCHHPKRHHVPKDELNDNPSALHNTRFKKEQRRLMLEGSRPKECGYCWDIEDNGSGYSDRIIKSTDSWAFDRLEEIRALPWDADVNPTYLEVMLDSVCNFSCAYCFANVSSSIADEVRRFGLITGIDEMDQHRAGYKYEPDIAYLEAFWKWLPQVLPELRVLRITGGEPLLSPRLDRIFDFIEANKSPGLTLVINSHLCHAPARVDRLIARVRRLLDSSSVQKFELYTSMEAHGARAEYIRHGLNYRAWLSSLRKLGTDLPEAQLVIMATFNILSLSSFKDLLRDVFALKQEGLKLKIDTHYLREPCYLRADVATPELIAGLHESLEFMQSAPSPGFSPHEIEKMTNVVKWVTRPSRVEQSAKNKRDLYHFLIHFDRRKKKDFNKIFPEYRDFYISCKKEVFESWFSR